MRAVMTSFTEHQRVLGLFADGVAGAALPIEVADDEHDVWPWRTSALDAPVVRVPAVADDLGALRAAVLHHTGFAEFGSYDAGRDERDRELASSVHPGLARRIFGALEDRRIDDATRAHYPGARRDLDAVLVAARGAVPDEPPAEWRAAIVESLQLHSLGASRDELLARIGAGRAPMLASVLDRVATIETADDSARVAAAIVGMLAEALDEEGDPTFAVTQTVDGDQDSTTQPPDERPSGDVPRPPSPDMRREEADHPQIGRLADVDAVDPDLPTVEEEAEARSAAPELVQPPGGDDRDARISFYDEWDHLAGRMLPAWCRVVERRLDGDDRTFIGDVRRRHGTLISRLRRQLAFIRPEGWVRVHHADDGDELDLEAVIEARVDRRTGHTVDDRLHVRRDRATRDVATAFLVDLSASTSSPLPDEDAEATADIEEEEDVGPYRGAWIDPYDLPPPEVGRRILDVAKESVAVMCDALELLGDRHAVYGFSGESRHRVDVHVVKEFDDRTSPATWAALAAMRSLKYTRMGPAVRHATAKLAAQPSRTKLLIVISDGYPQDIDYGPVRADREYGLQDTARALREAVDAGIAPYLLTIDPAGHEYLRRMLPAQSYVVIEDVHSLPGELAALYGSVASMSSRGW
jgi:hypothetical protein